MSRFDLSPDVLVYEFHQRGFVVLPGVLSSEETSRLRLLVERFFGLSAHASPAQDAVRGGVSLMRVFERHRAFRDLLVLEPVADLVELILGNDCHVVAQNALRIAPGKGIVRWHIDDELLFPFLAQVQAIPGQAVSVPCFTLNAMVALTDAEAEAFGPTQVVVGSHLTGTEPDRRPTLPATVEPTSVLVRAGDVYLVNSQTWHRGAPNTSDRVRYLITSTYGRRFIAQRFYPFLNYRMPRDVLDGASNRLQRLLGRHAKGPYG